MPKHFKLWQRHILADFSSKLEEIEGIDHLDLSKGTLMCLPGYSATHDKLREINGYMGLAQEMLGGREATANLISVSYNNTGEEAKNIEAFNKDPLHYASDAAKEFAHHILVPLLDSGQDVNIVSKSYGPVFYNMAMNELNNMGKKYDPSHIRFLATANVSRLNYNKREQATEIYMEGVNDTKAEKLNPYKEPPPSGHKGLTIVPLSESALHIFADVPKNIVHWKTSPKGITLEKVEDPEAHTTLLHTDPVFNPGEAHLISRILRNMLTLKGRAFTTETALRPCPPLAPLRHDIGHGENAFDARFTSVFVDQALARGRQSKEINAILFDWDLTLADGEGVTLNALNHTFKAIEKSHAEIPVQKEWTNLATMRQILSSAITIPNFFEQHYGKYGQTVVNEAIGVFEKYRSDHRDETKLMPGAKEILTYLRKQNIKVGIVSNKKEEALLELKARLLPEGRFPGIVAFGVKSGRKSKPSHEPIQEALKALGLRPDQASSVLFVGDQTVSDIAAALAAGCQPCLIGDSDKTALIQTSRHLLVQNGDEHTLLQHQSGHKVLHVKNLAALQKFLTAKAQKVDATAQQPMR